MIDYIYELCKEYNCSIGFHIDVDGANWSEENIKDCIKDVIRRACYD